MITITCAKPLTDIKGNDTVATVGSFLSEVMWNARENQSRGFMLAKKFATEDTVELKAEDIVFIKKVINTLGARAGEAGQIFSLLDGESEE